MSGWTAWCAGTAAQAGRRTPASTLPVPQTASGTSSRPHLYSSCHSCSPHRRWAGLAGTLGSRGVRADQLNRPRSRIGKSMRSPTSCELSAMLQRQGRSPQTRRRIEPALTGACRALASYSMHYHVSTKLEKNARQYLEHRCGCRRCRRRRRRQQRNACRQLQACAAGVCSNCHGCSHTVLSDRQLSGGTMPARCTQSSDALAAVPPLPPLPPAPSSGGISAPAGRCVATRDFPRVHPQHSGRLPRCLCATVNPARALSQWSGWCSTLRTQRGVEVPSVSLPQPIGATSCTRVPRQRDSTALRPAGAPACCRRSPTDLCSERRPQPGRPSSTVAVHRRPCRPRR